MQSCVKRVDSCDVSENGDRLQTSVLTQATVHGCVLVVGGAGRCRIDLRGHIAHANVHNLGWRLHAYRLMQDPAKA